jgi:hypothetical protein
MDRSQSQHPLLEIFSMVVRVAVSDGDDRSISVRRLLRLSEVLATDREGSGIHMDVLDLDPKDLTSAAGDAGNQLRQIVLTRTDGWCCGA